MHRLAASGMLEHNFGGGYTDESSAEACAEGIADGAADGAATVTATDNFQSGARGSSGGSVEDSAGKISSAEGGGVCPCRPAFAEAAGSIAALLNGAGVSDADIVGDLAEKVTANFACATSPAKALVSAPAISVGSSVRLCKLLSRPELNGANGTVLALLRSGRLGVKVAGECLSIGRQNAEALL